MSFSDTLTQETHLSISPEAYFVNLEDGIVILDLKKGQYLGLHDVGQRLWQMFSEGMNLGEIHHQLLEEYDISPDTLWQDLIILVQDMLQEGIIKIS